MKKFFLRKNKGGRAPHRQKVAKAKPK